jgi:hypothetical protein
MLHLDEIKTIKPKTINTAARLNRIPQGTTCGPRDSKSLPRYQGRDIPPRLAPTNSHPVTFPLIPKRREAMETSLGKIEAIERPKPKVVIHNTLNESDQTSIITKLA